MATIAEALENAGFATFLPQRDGVEMLAMRSMKAPAAGTMLAAPGSKMMRKAVFGLDLLELLDRSNAVVVNLNGRVPDEGAVVEASLAFAAGIPVIAYKRDVRAPFRGMENPMLSGVTGWSAVKSIDELPAAVAKAIESAPPRKDVTLSAELTETLEFGRKVRGLLDRFPALRLPNSKPDPLIEKLVEAERQR